MSLFNKDIVTVLKPFLAFAIILHHLCVYQDVSYLHEFERWGPLVVGMFFFISGYGLSFNRLHNWGGYLKGFITRNILKKLFLPTACAFILNMFLNYHSNVYDIEKHLFNPSGMTFFPNDWFIYALIFCYSIFYISNTFKATAGRFTFQLALLCLFVVFCAQNGWHRNWWATPLAFLMGQIYYTYEQKIIGLIAGIKMYIFCNVVLSAFFASLFVLGIVIGSHVSTAIVYSTLPVWVVICLTHIDLRTLAKNRIILFFGSISFEIYLLHGIIMDFLRDNTVFRQTVFLFATVALTVISAYVFRKIVSYIKMGLSKITSAQV